MCVFLTLCLFVYVLGFEGSVESYMYECIKVCVFGCVHTKYKEGNHEEMRCDETTSGKTIED